MKITLFVNSAKTFFWHRKSLADFLQTQGHEVVIISSDDGEQDRFKELPYRVEIVPFSRKSMNPLREILLLVKLIKIFCSEKPSISHNFTVKCVVYGSIAQKIAGVPLIVNSITGLGYAFIRGGYIQNLIENLYRIAFLFSGSKIVFQNVQDYQLFTQKRIASGEASYIIEGSGVDLKKFEPSSVKYPEITIIFAGRLLKSKGLRELFKASENLIQSGTEHRLVICGEIDQGNPDSYDESEIQEIQRSQKQIEFLGNIIEIAQTLSKSHIACLPSYREGLSKFLIEASACGLPIVTTDAPGCRELIDGNGYIVPVRDSIELTRKLKELIENSQLRLEMGLKSRDLACDRYNQDSVFAQVVEIYNK